MDLQPTMEDLAADYLIRQTLSRYWRGVDRLDLELIRSAFHDDAIDHHAGHDRLAHDFAAAAVERMPKVAPGGTQHRVGNVSIERQGDRAWCEAYYHAIHNAGDRLNELFGRYVHRFECRAGEWKIAERWAVLDFTQTVERTAAPSETNPGTPRGTADRNDISYTRWW